MKRWEASHKIYEGNNKIDVVWLGARAMTVAVTWHLTAFSKQAKRMLTSARHADSGPRPA